MEGPRDEGKKKEGLRNRVRNGTVWTHDECTDIPGRETNRKREKSGSDRVQDGESTYHGGETPHQICLMRLNGVKTGWMGERGSFRPSLLNPHR